ncbi:hypothetical protein ACFL39_00555 [Gemmatimonadota bacterium]
MAKLFYIHGGAKSAIHLQHTVLTGIAHSSIESLVSSEEYSELHKIYGEQPVRVWGSVPTKGNRSTWNRMRVGDLLLIYRNDLMSHVARIALKMNKRNLAISLWEKAEEPGHTWELMYFLKDLQEVNIPVRKFAESIGYSSDWTPRGFGSISSERVHQITLRFGSIEYWLAWLQTDEDDPIQNGHEAGIDHLRSDIQGHLQLECTTPREVCNSIKLDWGVAIRLSQEGWISFDVQKEGRLSFTQHDELVFVGALTAAGINNQMLKILLNGLTFPYCYPIHQVYFDWRRLEWQPLVTIPDEYDEELFNVWADNLVSDDDIQTLTAIAQKTLECIEDIGKKTE